MNIDKIKHIIQQGEGLQVEFKKSQFELNKDVFDSVCGFLNANNPNKLNPPCYLTAEIIDVADKKIVYAYVPESSAYPAKLIIEKDQVITENWNRAHGVGDIDPNNFTPYPKNPVIARFFKEIGWVDELGSGVRNVYKYAPVYTPGTNPFFIEGDVFKTVIPLSIPDTRVNEAVNERLKQDVGVNVGVNDLLNIITDNPGINAKALLPYFDVTDRTLERWLKQLREEGKIEFRGAPKTGGYWKVK